ncbi:hypothetical protein TUA1478L_14780 [Lactiplantibacillus plantarum]
MKGALTGWRRNLAVLWLGTFIAGMGFSEVMPFLSLYVGQMGISPKTNSRCIVVLHTQ